ncbi:MAG TPA: hypothetical protein VER96_28945 [Polyangiaceae bacterium]|nr:hypothetical protein [Polyangiaceae bacterium]
MTESKKSEAFALGDAQFAVCQRVEDFLGTSVRPILQRAEPPGPELDTYHGAIIRVHGWLRSVAKLNHPGDFQPVLAASRAIFEVAIDLSLLNRDPTQTCAKLLAWEDSAKLHSAERLKSFCDAHPNQGPPAGTQAILAFLAQRPRVLALRSLHWSHQSHPPRWTGRNLGQDADSADRLSPSGFAEYYNARYPQICWNVHGSGLAGVRGISEENFPGLTMFGFAESANFALIAAREALALVGKWDPVSQVRFEHLEKELSAIRVAVWTSHSSK